MSGGRERGGRGASLPAVVGWLGLLSAPWLLAAALILVGLIGAGDYLTGSDVSFAVVYLIPVFLSATAHRSIGMAIAGVAALTWSSIEVVLWTSPLPHMLVPAWNTVSRFSVLWLFAVLVSALAARLAAERSLSRTDPLTRLPNNRAFHESADAEIARMRRASRPLTVAYIDIDDFKTINDTYGHSEGDKVLTQVADAMTSVLRATDHVARLGGDEFAILLPETSLKEALGLLRRLHANLVVHMLPGRRPFGVSIGAVTFVDPPRSRGELIDAADRVMYEAKQQGKNMILGEQATVGHSAADPSLRLGHPELDLLHRQGACRQRHASLTSDPI